MFVLSRINRDNSTLEHMLNGMINCIERWFLHICTTRNDVKFVDVSELMSFENFIPI